ncbi:MAG: hypothetical protein ACXW3E_02615 [Thermoanaerobaculia bacterium]
MALLTLIGTIVMAVTVMTIGAIAFVRRHRDRIRGSGSLGNAMQEIEGLFVESKAHVLKVDRAEEAEEEAASGDPPEK